MTSEEVFRLPKALQARIKEEAKDDVEWEKLNKKNPELAKLVEDVNNIITGWAYEVATRIEGEMQSK